MRVPWKPHKFQETAIKFGLQHGSAGFFLSPGYGKTSIVYALFKVLRSKQLVNRALVIAPLRPAVSTWPAEAAKWEDFRDITTQVLHGAGKEELGRASVEIINPEGLSWLFSQVKGEWPWDMLVVDESTRFKHANTLRFKTLRPHLHRFRRRYILTGTPAPNGLLDLFGQIYILDMGNALGRYITHYRNSYFDSVGYGGYTWVPRKDSADKIYEKLKPLVYRVFGDEYIKLPPLINNTIEVELPKEARKVYTQMEALLLAEWKGNTITAANSGAATMKCRQIANGGAYSEQVEGSTRRSWANIHDTKTEAVQELVEELSGQPALVAYEFQHDLERLQKAFPDAPYLGGGVNPKKQREVELAWNNGLLPVLFVQPQSVAHGLNLQGTAAAVILHSLFWDLEMYEQLVRRVWRQGQKERVVVHHIVAKGTVDEALMRGIARKDKTQKALLDALKTHLNRR
jgi:SNF2 family DNA or RNA helicase